MTGYPSIVEPPGIRACLVSYCPWSNTRSDPPGEGEGTACPFCGKAVDVAAGTSFAHHFELVLAGVVGVVGTVDPCPSCGGSGGRPRVMASDEDYTVSRGWVDCPDCGGTGKRAECLYTPVLGLGDVERGRAHNDECPEHGRKETGR